ncbi:cytochrome c [Zoogloea sp.]|uniref:c-type cytochrome n=1 Tax=Zoogloea sp. TaxID=49181 RepID=UPI0025FC327E|nr:cytochrome c [Zoogloea sp.]MCK6394403.1 cytochrome c [Zoogloea sp.]
MINKSSLMACALASFLAPALAFNAVLPEKAADESAPAAKTEAASLNLPFELTNKARIVSGRDRFQSTCAAFCHGHEPALFIGRDGLEPQYVYNTIRDGGKGATPMPPWGEVFSAEEIWEIVAYLKSLGKW